MTPGADESLHGAAARLSRAGLLLASFGIGIALGPGLAAVFTLPKLMVLSAAILFCAVGAVWSGLAGRPFGRSAVDAALGLCVACLALCAAFSQDRILSVLGMYNYYAYGAWPLAMCACLCLFAARAGAGLRRDSVRHLLAGGACVGGYGSLQALGFDPIPSIGAVLTGGRAVSALGSPISLGAFEAMLLPVAVYWVAHEKRRKAFGWLCLTLIAAGLLFSGARAGWLGAAAGLALFAGLMARRRLPASREARLAMVLAGLAVCAAVSWRFAVRLRAREDTDAARVEIWRIAWKVFKEAPLLGTGPDTFELGFRRNRTEDFIKFTTTDEYQAHAHNDVLQALATTGLVGTASYAWLIVCLALACGRSLADPGRRPLASACAAGLASLFVSMKFNPAPLETFVSAALLAGFMADLPEPGAQAKTSGRGKPCTTWWVEILALFGIASACLALALFMADRRFMRWQVASALNKTEEARGWIEGAYALNPCEVSYRMAYVRDVPRLYAAGTHVKGALLDSASDLGRTAVSCHPRSSQAHFTLGAAELLQAQAGRLEKLATAEAELDKALELDPNFVAILQVRLQAALLRREPARTQSLIRRIQYLQALPHRYVSRGK